jgi:hypothetical protein
VVAAAELLLASVLWVVFTRSRTSVEKPSVTALRQDC